MSKSVREELIKALANGEFVSGQILGDRLGVSRTSVSKHIKTLTEMGLDVFRVTGKGYKLVQPLSLLSKDKIAQYLRPENKNNCIEVHTLIDSTNSYLMRILANDMGTYVGKCIQQGQVCIAEYQSAGRGRRGRQWISPFGSHLYLSMYWQLKNGLSTAMGLSLVIALAVSDAIRKLYSIEVQLKWPNDIYLQGVKLAGILIELEGQTSGPSHSIIGIGVNLKMPLRSAAEIDQPWTDLQAHTQIHIDRNELCAEIINALIIRLTQHQDNGLSSMVSEWHNQDVYLNKNVNLITGDRMVKGICRGINEQGALILEVEGIRKAIYGGEVSLRGDL